jgi:Rrf2 family iron-sulfur cluster assembly transcriptional regulator
MLRRRGLQAIKALLELALAPAAWHSVNDLARAQELPAPMLEQLMLRLRRAELVEARRGRHGGYRLLRPPAAIPLAEILQAVEAAPTTTAVEPEAVTGDRQEGAAADQVTAALERRLQRALVRELAHISLEDLLYDLHSARALLREDGGLLLG